MYRAASYLALGVGFLLFAQWPLRDLVGADHVVNYRKERFEGEVRRLTKRKGVDVVFEHVGADTWNGSLLCLKRGGRLVTCGATTGDLPLQPLMTVAPREDPQYVRHGQWHGWAFRQQVHDSRHGRTTGRLPKLVGVRSGTALCLRKEQMRLPADLIEPVD